ncbi:MAG: hypothetical protein QOD42_3350 [Sphingomonadales bacterium]|jgi:hypothetical protein|nr:hypothetical protein [Sphingomonadales bacterium]
MNGVVGRDESPRGRDEAAWRRTKGEGMAHPVGAQSNTLFEILAEWNAVLQDTSLADDPPEDEFG